MKRHSKYEKHRNPRRQPLVRALVALHDTDERALLIDITPVNLTDTCCPLCGGQVNNTRPRVGTPRKGVVPCH